MVDSQGDSARQHRAEHGHQETALEQTLLNASTHGGRRAAEIVVRASGFDPFSLRRPSAGPAHLLEGDLVRLHADRHLTTVAGHGANRAAEGERHGPHLAERALRPPPASREVGDRDFGPRGPKSLRREHVRGQLRRQHPRLGCRRRPHPPWRRDRAPSCATVARQSGPRMSGFRRS